GPAGGGGAVAVDLLQAKLGADGLDLARALEVVRVDMTVLAHAFHGVRAALEVEHHRHRGGPAGGLASRDHAHRVVLRLERRAAVLAALTVRTGAVLTRARASTRSVAGGAAGPVALPLLPGRVRVLDAQQHPHVPVHMIPRRQLGLLAVVRYDMRG